MLSCGFGEGGLWFGLGVAFEDVSTYPRRHVIVVKHAGERQTFSVHEVAHNHVEWVGGQGHYKLGYAAAIRLMAEKVFGRA